MAQTERVEVTVTGTEQDALLLEYNLIKEHHPRFNVVLRDDKSYPWIYVSTQQEFPRFEFHRGSQAGARPLPGPVAECRGSAREPGPTPEAVPRAPVFRVVFCESHPTLPAVPDQALHGSLRRTDRGRRSIVAMWRTPSSFSRGGIRRYWRASCSRMEQASAELDYERAAVLRDQVCADPERSRPSRSLPARVLRKRMCSASTRTRARRAWPSF